MKKECGLLMRQKRKLMRLTARELAERTGISLPFLTLVERGGCDDISIGYAAKIEEALDLPVGFFGERVGSQEPQKDTNAADAADKCANGNCSLRLFCVRFVVCHGLAEVHKYPRHSCRKGHCDQYVPRGTHIIEAAKA